MGDNSAARSITRCIWFKSGCQIRSVLRDRLDMHEKDCRHRSNKCPFGCFLWGLKHSEVRGHIKQCIKEEGPDEQSDLYQVTHSAQNQMQNSLDWDSIPPDKRENVRERQLLLLRRVEEDLEGFRPWKKGNLQDERTPNHRKHAGMDLESIPTSKKKRKSKNGTQCSPAQLHRPLLNDQTFVGNFRPGQPRCLSCLQRSLPANSISCPSLTCDLNGESFALPSFMHRHMIGCFKDLPPRCSECVRPSGYLAHDPRLTTSSTIPRGCNIESLDLGAVTLAKWPERAENNPQMQRAGFCGKEITTPTSAGPGLWSNTEDRALQPEERLNKVIISRKILTIEEMCNRVLIPEAR